MSDAMIFRGGMPYGPDVNKLKEAFPVPSLVEGRLITHEQLENVLEYKKGSSRFYGVVNSWINAQRNEFGLFITWEPTKGVLVQPPDGVLIYSEKKLREKGRQTGRAAKNFAWVDGSRLDDMGQRRLDNGRRVANAMKQSALTGLKELACDLAPIKSLPKPKLIRAS